MSANPEGVGITRRSVFCAAAGLFGRFTAWADQRADVTLRIGRVRHDVAPGHSIVTTGYSGGAPGPLIRLREGEPVTVDLFNDTDATEYVHWHGFEIPAAIDGTEEEGSLAVPARGQLRYRMTPRNVGSRYVHSHAMAMDDLTRGVYSSQFACVWVEPKRSSGAFDQEVFLATHEWEAYLADIDLDDLAASGDNLDMFGAMGSRGCVWRRFDQWQSAGPGRADPCEGRTTRLLPYRQRERNGEYPAFIPRP